MLTCTYLKKKYIKIYNIYLESKESCVCVNPILLGGGGGVQKLLLLKLFGVLWSRNWHVTVTEMNIFGLIYGISFRESTFKLTTSYSLWPTKSYEVCIHQISWSLSVCGLSNKISLLSFAVSKKSLRQEPRLLTNAWLVAVLRSW